MEDSLNIKNKNFFFILQRDWGIKTGFEIVKKLNKNGNRFSALNFKEPVESYAVNQKEVKFDYILNDNQIFNNKEKILEESNYTTQNFIEDYNISSLWKYAFTLRRLATSYEKKFPYSFQQNLNDAEFEKYILAFAYKLKKTFYDFKPDIVIGYVFGDIRHIMLNKLCEINKIPMVCAADSKIHNINIFTYDYKSTRSFFHDRMKKLNQKIINSKNFNKAKDYLNDQRKNFKKNVMVENINFEKNIFNFQDFKNFLSKLKRYLYLKLTNKTTDKNFLHPADNPSFRYLIRDFFSETYNTYRLKKIKYEKIDNIENFVYFPLGHYPETQLGILNTVYDNQINTIKVIARYLPKNLTLVIKDHPFSFGLKSYSFLEKIQNTPNVKLIKYDEDNIKIFKKMHSLISFCGTVIFEACIFKKPGIQIGAAELMTYLPNCYKMDDLTSIEKIIENIDTSFRNYAESKEYDEKIINYICAAFDTGFKFDEYESDLRLSNDKLNSIWSAYKIEISKILKFQGKFLFNLKV